MLCAVCCALCAVCCVLCAVCGALLYAVCCVPPTVCGVRCAVCGVLCAVCCVLRTCCDCCAVQVTYNLPQHPRSGKARHPVGRTFEHVMQSAWLSAAGDSMPMLAINPGARNLHHRHAGPACPRGADHRVRQPPDSSQSASLGAGRSLVPAGGLAPFPVTPSRSLTGLCKPARPYCMFKTASASDWIPRRLTQSRGQSRRGNCVAVSPLPPPFG